MTIEDVRVFDGDCGGRGVEPERTGHFRWTQLDKSRQHRECERSGSMVVRYRDCTVARLHGRTAHAWVGIAVRVLLAAGQELGTAALHARIEEQGDEIRSLKEELAAAREQLLLSKQTGLRQRTVQVWHCLHAVILLLRPSVLVARVGAVLCWLCAHFSTASTAQSTHVVGYNALLGGAHPKSCRWCRNVGFMPSHVMSRDAFSNELVSGRVVSPRVTSSCPVVPC